MSNGINFYTVRDGRNYIDVANLSTPELRKAAVDQCNFDGHMERLKSAGLMILTGTVAMGEKVIIPLAVAIVAFQVASIAASILFCPLFLLPGLYDLTASLAGLALGFAAFGAYVGFANGSDKTKNYMEELFNRSVAHWNYSNHLYDQAILVQGDNR